MIISQLQRS